jgi:hypothetical protein
MCSMVGNICFQKCSVWATVWERSFLTALRNCARRVVAFIWYHVLSVIIVALYNAHQKKNKRHSVVLQLCLSKSCCYCCESLESQSFQRDCVRKCDVLICLCDMALQECTHTQNRIINLQTFFLPRPYKIWDFTLN